jgi:hypothetical protein
MEKTHWKKVVSDPNFIGEADFEEGEEKVATIARVANAVDVQTAEGKSKKAVVYFAENLKPMILNVARSKSITKVAGSPYFEDWVGVKIQLYIEKNIKAFGDIVNAVRVRATKPIIKNAIKCADCGSDIQGASGKSADYIASYTKKKFGVCLCFGCASARGAEKSTETVQTSTEIVEPSAEIVNSSNEEGAN